MPCDVPELLYALNGWIGDRGDRIVIVKSFANVQPSFDALWAPILSQGAQRLEPPLALKFPVFNYGDLDQLAETTEQRNAVQSLIGCLGLAMMADCNSVLFSTTSARQIEFYEDRMAIGYDDLKSLEEVQYLLDRHRISF